VKKEENQNLQDSSFKSLSFDFSTIKALLATTNRYRTLFESAGDAIFVLNLNGQILDANRIACKRLGYTRKEILELNYMDIESSDYKKEAAKRMDELRRHGHVIHETSHQCKNGKIIPIEVNNRIIEYDHNPAILTIARDIRDRKEAEKEKALLQAQLRQAQKMEAIGTLAGGIAHDFNNILTPISGYTELAMRKIPIGSQARKNLEQVLNAVRRAKSLVQQILTFSRREGQKKFPLQIQSILKEALKLLRASLPAIIEIRTDINASGNVIADPTQIHQIILNLCTNAHYAMKETDGIMEITLCDVELDIQEAKIAPGLKAGPYVKLTVRDTGCGMDKEVLERIFEPYFTTKPEGEGTGMGLSVVHGIVQGHSGDITVTSKPGKGTIFTVYLPRIPYDQQVVDKSPSRVPIPKGNEEILLIDDEKTITDVMEQMLYDLGYKVVVKNEPLKALESFRINPFRFDLVITDLTMPKITGLKLAGEIRKIRKNIPIMIATGNKREISADAIEALGIGEIMLKPPTIEEIGRTVRKLLDKSKKPRNNTAFNIPK
jgi:PAS domain S-box-containing protein